MMSAPQMRFCALLLLLGARTCSADDLFLLESGGKLVGRWLNRDEKPHKDYQIETSSGVRLTLGRNQVSQVVSLSEHEAEYERLRPTYPDTAAAHAELAKWCAAHKLPHQRREHLKRVLELDPDNEPARQALGYRRVSGKWMTRKEELAAKGLVFYEGRYRTKQEIEILESEKADKVVERTWSSNIKLWRGWLEKEGRAAEGRANLMAIRDPVAILPLTRFLGQEPIPAVRLMYLDVLSQIGTPDAVEVLVHYSLEDPNKEIRLTCIDHVLKLAPPNAAGLYLRALKSKNNRIVNRAGLALGKLKDPQTIGPLIDALVTEHKFQVSTGSPGQMNSSFNPNGGGGGGGFTFGGGGPQIVKRQLPNPEVLTALLNLAGGANFQFDVKSWKRWYVSVKKSEALDARRD